MHSNKETSYHLGVGESTLRKWCIELEKNGYLFNKGLKESRMFSEDDLQALLYFKQLSRVYNHNKEQAAKAVVKRFISNETQSLSRSIENIEFLLEKIFDLIEKRDREQKEFNNTLIKKLDCLIKELNEKKKKEGD